MASTLHGAANVATVALFLVCIGAPTLDLFVRDDVARGPGPENRGTAQRPPLPRTAADFAAFPAAYEAHFADTCGLRDVLLRWNSAEKYFVFHISPTREQAAGRDGWIYYAGDSSGPIQRGVLPLSTSELEAWQRELEVRSSAHAAAGRRYLFVLVPNKETIYPERTPGTWRPVGPTRLDQFCAWMRDRSEVDVLDLRSAFLAAKSDDLGPLDTLYSPYGTHWTARGVHAAYAAIVGHLAAGTGRDGPRPLSDFDVVRWDEGLDTFAGNLYLTGLLVQPGYELRRKGPDTHDVLERRAQSPSWIRTRGRGTNLLPPTVFFHDSFGPFLAPTLAQSFQRLDLSEAPYDPSRIDAASTRIVVEMYVERYLFTHVPGSEPEPPLAARGGSSACASQVLFDLSATPERARAVDGLVLTRTDAGALRMQRGGIRDGCLIGPVSLPGLGCVRLLVDFESDVPETLEVLWRRKGAGDFKRVDRTLLPIGAERDQRDVELPALGAECEFFLRPAARGSTIVVHSLVVKSERAP